MIMRARSARLAAAGPLQGRVPDGRLAAAALAKQQQAAAASGGSAPSRKPRWPLLRNKHLTNAVAAYMAPGAQETLPQRLWVVGPPGSGAATTVQAAMSQLTNAGAAGGPAIVAFDCASSLPEGSPSPKSHAELERALLKNFANVLKEQIGFHFASAGAIADASAVEAAVVAAIQAVLQRVPEASSELLASIEDVGRRGGLVNILPRGTEVPGIADAIAAHRQDMPRLVLEASKCILKVPFADTGNLSVPGAGRRGSYNEVAVALTLLDQTAASSSEGLRKVKSLLGYLAGLATSLNREAIVVVLRAHTFTRPPLKEEAMQASLGSGAPLGVSLWMALQEEMLLSRSLRVVLQSTDGVAVARAHDAGDRVLSVDAWSQEMARAVLIPRYLSQEEAEAWPQLWSTVGGHAGHLRRVAELIVEERAEQARQREEEEAQKRQQWADSMEDGGQRSQDAENYAKEGAKEQEDDSFRWDSREAVNPVEAVLRKLPEGLSSDVDNFYDRMTAFSRHPLLEDVQSEHATNQGKAFANLSFKLLDICALRSITVPPDGFGALDDTVLLALLDVGLLLPNIDREDRSLSLILPNELTRSMLLSWIDSHASALPCREWLQYSFCRWQHQRQQDAAAKRAALAKSAADASAGRDPVSAATVAGASSSS